MPIHRTHFRHGLKRKFTGGKVRSIRHPMHRGRPALYTPFVDTKINLSGPIVGGSAMSKLSAAMRSFGNHPPHHRGHMRGGAISYA